MEPITWEEEWVEGGEGEPYYVERAALGDYSASVSYLGAFIDYNGLPAALGVGITLDDSVLAGVDFAECDWAEERLRYRAEHGHTSADITSASGPSHRQGGLSLPCRGIVARHHTTGSIARSVWSNTITIALYSAIEEMIVKLSDIDLTTKEAITLRRWLADLDRHYELEAAMRETEATEQAQAEEIAEKLVANARECASLHGPIPWMLTGYQATAAWETWMENAEYYEIDEHFQPDDADQELWESAYRNRLEELKRSRTS